MMNWRGNLKREMIVDRGIFSLGEQDRKAGMGVLESQLNFPISQRSAKSSPNSQLSF